LVYFLFIHLNQTRDPYNGSYSEKTRIQEMLRHNTSHHKVGIRWYTQAILKMSRHWNNAQVTTAFGHSHTEMLALRSRGTIPKIHDSLPHKLSTIGDPALHQLHIWRDEWEQHRLFFTWDTWKI